MATLHFDNRFTRELPGDPVQENFTRQVSDCLWSAVLPTPVKQPTLLAYSPQVAAMLGLSANDMQSPALIDALAGNRLLPGMHAYATRYGGHQFGHWAGQLGDGRAIYLGECVHAAHRFELQLKGAGETPYSRRADGRAVLRSSLREFLCSEAMHHLGVPTTRALSLVGTGENVLRDMFYDGNATFEPGAIVCRVAPSFTRFGHFEILASRGEHALLKQLVHFTIDRDFADWRAATGWQCTHATDNAALVSAWFSEVCHRTAVMVAHWMRVGFVHGVMNTDNMSILGLTIDYGPYGWVDHFDPGWTPNTTDAQGRRYCFGRQADIARWNLARLADALAPLCADVQGLNGGLETFDHSYGMALTEAFSQKFGWDTWQADDGALVNRVFELMTRAEVDMTLFFNGLAEVDISAPSLKPLQSAFYTEKGFLQYADDFEVWLKQYAARVRASTLTPAARLSKMATANPVYVLRNYLAQEAIELATAGDMSRLHTLLKLLENPYQLQAGMAQFRQKRPEWARKKAGCSMLSCSS